MSVIFQTTQKKLENAVLRLRRNLKTPTFRFSVDKKHFEAEILENDEVTIIMISRFQSFALTQIQNDSAVIVGLKTFFIVVWRENI